MEFIIGIFLLFGLKNINWKKEQEGSKKMLSTG